MKKIIYSLSAMLLLLTGCYEDKSTLPDNPISVITIEGIDESYSKMSFVDNLEIKPKVSSTDPADTFEYLWTIYDANANETGSPVPADTIGRAKDLDWLVSLKPGKYNVVLRVTNTSINPNYAQYATTTLETNTEFTTGYFFLKETADGNTELDFMNPEGSMAENLIEQSIGTPIEGSPTRLGYLINYSFIEPGGTPSDLTTSSVLVPMSEKDLRMFRISDMQLVYDHQTMFYGDEPDEKPIMAIGFGGFSSPKYISNTGSYTTSQMPSYGSLGTGKYGFSVAPSGGCSFNRNTIVPTGDFGGSYVNLFDEQNGNFVWVSGNNTMPTLTYDLPIPGEGENPPTPGAIPPTGIGHKLLFMSFLSMEYIPSGYRFDYFGRAVFEDATDPSKRHIYKLNVGDTHNPIVELRTIESGLNINNARIFCNNKDLVPQMLYGAVGDKVYMYNTDSGAETLLSFQDMGSGEEITMLAYKYDLEEYYLTVATHKNGKYKVYMYSTIGTGEPYGKPALVAEGDGKVVDLQYASTDMYMGYVYDPNY